MAKRISDQERLEYVKQCIRQFRTLRILLKKDSLCDLGVLLS